MKRAVTAFLVLYVVAVICSAQVLSQETKPAQPGGVLGGLVKDLSKEVAGAGEILVAVAKTLGQIDLKQDDEYFLRDLWKKAVEAVQNAGKKIKEVAENAAGDVKTALQKAAESTKQKAQEKALEILAKIMGDSIATYAAEDLDAQTAFLDQVCNKLDKTGKKLIAHGLKL